MIPDRRIGIAVARACRDGAGWREDALLVDGVGLVERVAGRLAFILLVDRLHSGVIKCNASPHLAALIKAVRHTLQWAIGPHENVVAVDVLADQLVVARVGDGAAFGGLHKPILDRLGYADFHAALLCCRQVGEHLVVAIHAPLVAAAVAKGHGRHGHAPALGILVGLAAVESQDVGLDSILLAKVLPLHQLGGLGLGELAALRRRIGHFRHHVIDLGSQVGALGLDVLGQLPLEFSRRLRDDTIYIRPTQRLDRVGCNGDKAGHLVRGLACCCGGGLLAVEVAPGRIDRVATALLPVQVLGFGLQVELDRRFSADLRPAAHDGGHFEPLVARVQRHVLVALIIDHHIASPHVARLIRGNGLEPAGLGDVDGRLSGQPWESTIRVEQVQPTVHQKRLHGAQPHDGLLLTLSVGEGVGAVLVAHSPSSLSRIKRAALSVAQRSSRAIQSPISPTDLRCSSRNCSRNCLVISHGQALYQPT